MPILFFRGYYLEGFFIKKSVYKSKNRVLITLSYSLIYISILNVVPTPTTEFFI